jgi:hypothetical protein
MRETTHMKKWIRQNWVGWIESYEPRLGSNLGIPDIQVIVGRRIVPIELKIGYLRDGVLFPSGIRPAQVNWHRRLAEFDVLSIFLFGVGEGNVPEHLFAVPGDSVKHWAAGFELENLAEISVDPKQFTNSLKSYIERREEICRLRSK